MTGAPWAWALGATLLAQTAGAFLTRAVPVFAPVLAERAGVPPEQVGQLAALNAFGTVCFLVAGGLLLARFGAVALLVAGGIGGAAAVALLLADAWWVMLLASLLIGFAYGPTQPAGSEILGRHAPPAHRALIFSLKQAGVPLGGAIAGALVPFLVGVLEWRDAVLATAVIAALPVLLVWSMRFALEPATQRQPAETARNGALLRLLWEPFQLLTLAPALPSVTAIGFALAAAQGALFAVFVTILVAGLDWSFERAGLCFAIMQVAGVLGRIAFGVVADRRGAGMGTLLGLGVASGLSLASVVLLDSSWPSAAVIALSAVLGLLAGGWNGVCLAEVARVAPAGRVGEATSSATFFIFLGYVAGPAALALLAGQLDARMALAVVGAAPLLVALLLPPRLRQR